jgi:hypothetical protein
VSSQGLLLLGSVFVIGGLSLFASPLWRKMQESDIALLERLRDLAEAEPLPSVSNWRRLVSGLAAMRIASDERQRESRPTQIAAAAGLLAFGATIVLRGLIS